MRIKKRILKREELVLAAMSPAQGKQFQPVHVQKLFFLIDMATGAQLGGKYFDFRPYDYGPFDSEVYSTLDRLEINGLVEVLQGTGWNPRRYRLTPLGQKNGEKFIGKLPDEMQEYLKDICKFVRRLSFAQLVAAIYKAYPEMKANSVFSS